MYFVLYSFDTVVSNSMASDLSYIIGMYTLVQLCDHSKSSTQWYTTILLFWYEFNILWLNIDNDIGFPINMLT